MSTKPATEFRSAAVTLYLRLLKQNLMRVGFEDRYRILSRREITERAPSEVANWVATNGLCLAEERSFDPEVRKSGHDWPSESESMIGAHRLDNIESCLRDVIENDVPGDLIETGVWRGGACIFMRGILAAYGETRRTVWVADDFRAEHSIREPLQPVDWTGVFWRLGI